MKLSFLSIVILFTNCYAFKLPSTPQIAKMNDNIYQHYDHLGKYKSWFEPNLFSTIHDFNKDDVVDFSHKAGNEVVKIISAGLPNVDSIGHRILHANDVYINSILNNDNIPHEVQKMLILSSIKLAQYGDDMGSKLLTLYYNLVDYCL